MRTVILELLATERPEEDLSDILHQLVCDCMATAMYRCMEHIPLDREGLAKVRLAEYGFSKEEIEKSISKLENE